MSKQIVHKVRFGEVDGAGIVFYPRYFEMLNEAVEDWFEEQIGVSFAELHLKRGIGTPTVAIEAHFEAPSRLGEELVITITPVELSRASCKLNFAIACEGQTRMRAFSVLVCMDLEAQKSAPWPADVRAAIEANIRGSGGNDGVA